MMRLFFVLAIVGAGACSSNPPVMMMPDAGPFVPPRVCKTPGAPAMPWFSDATGDVGLAKSATLEPLALSIASADFDGDGNADLLMTAGDASRGIPATGKRTRFLMLNVAGVFTDKTMESGLLATRDGAGDRGWNLQNAGDLDGDGDVDLVLCPADALSAMYSPKDACDAFLNDGKAHFTLADSSDLNAKVFWVPSAALLDYDRDGILDFWPAPVAPCPSDPSGPNRMPPTLFRGNGDGTFANVSAAVGLPTTDGTVAAGTQWRHMFGATACDIDGDGDDDLIAASYGRQENQVWRNDDGHFTNVAAMLGIDHDDREDYSDDQSYRCWCQNNPGMCPMNIPAPVPGFCTALGGTNGRGWFPGVTDKPYSLGGNNFTIACGDIDDDGDMDLMPATIVHGDVGSSADPTELVINPGNGGKFTRPGNTTNGIDRPEMGINWNHGDDMTVFADVDLDGRKDIFSTTTGAYEAQDRPRLWHQKPDGTFEEIAVPVGLVGMYGPNLQGPAFIDFDKDGDLDLVVGDTSKGTVRAYRNDIGQDRNWLRVRLRGKGAGGSNTSAIGAIVRVKAGGRTQTQYVSGGYGHGNVQADFVLTFGLGSACDVDEVSVRWPDASGTTTKYANVRSNYEITLKEGTADPVYRTLP